MSSKTNIKENDNTKKLCIFLAFFIPLTVALIALYSGGFAPFGKRDVLTSGGFEKYRYLVTAHQLIRDLSLLRATTQVQHGLIIFPTRPTF